MVQKRRSPGQTAVSLSIEAGLLRDIDARAAALGLSRSVYLAMLARADISQRGELVIQEKNHPAAPLQTDTEHKVLAAVKKMARYSRPARLKPKQLP